MPTVRSLPALLALEALGFRVEVTAGKSSMGHATRGDESYAAEDPDTGLGRVRLVEVRSWDWAATDAEIDAAFQRFPLL